MLDSQYAYTSNKGEDYGRHKTYHMPYLPGYDPEEARNMEYLLSRLMKIEGRLTTNGCRGYFTSSKKGASEGGKKGGLKHVNLPPKILERRSKLLNAMPDQYSRINYFMEALGIPLDDQSARSRITNDLKVMFDHGKIERVSGEYGRFSYRRKQGEK